MLCSAAKLVFHQTNHTIQDEYESLKTHNSSQNLIPLMKANNATPWHSGLSGFGSRPQARSGSRSQGRKIFSHGFQPVYGIRAH